MSKPWREIVAPHRDVLEGTFQQSEFAADLTAVHNGKATKEYQDPAAFFERTYITQGMSLLLTQVANRLSGKGGDPVIQLQTAFGGGKTHTMLAVYHLAHRKCPLGDLAGIPSLLDAAGIMDVPQARVAVIDGTAHAPGQAWHHGKTAVNTLWGELAWQLGGADGYAMVKDSDASGTSPGKDVLCDLMAAYAPCVVLMDELVAYIRQFADSQQISGGTYDSNLSFVQALTEAVKQVPNAIVVASLPESEAEAGSQRGVAALRALERIFGRVQALWRPVATEEAFEIVRRRLFEPVHDAKGRDATCRAFADLYATEGARLPSETQEARYHDRLVQAFPIHPEVFDRLYEDWTTIDGFQRTRGVLKLMAKAIFSLWKTNNADAMIMPASLPLADSGTRNELTYYLNQGWDPVVEGDIDGERSETNEMERKETRFGQVQAARRVARTLFLGTAPSAVATKPGTRGMERARILLGCVQPGQTTAIYSDALNRLSDRLHYLNFSGERSQDTTRFWFDTRANLRRDMEDRKRRFDDKADVRPRIAEVMTKLTANLPLFGGSHPFTAHADVPDDGALRLVILPPECGYSREDKVTSADCVAEYVKMNGSKPRYRANRLLFLAADRAVVNRLNDTARTALAWKSIVKDIADTRLVVDQLQQRQAQKELETIEEVLPRVARECYRWLLCPTQNGPSDTAMTVEAFQVHTTGTNLSAELERVCTENELVISTWSPIHLRSRLKDLYWKADRHHAQASQVWEDTQRYLYLPRLKNRDTFSAAVRSGSSHRDFFGLANGFANSRYEGFSLGSHVIQVDDTTLLVDPATAAAYEEANRKKVDPQPAVSPSLGGASPGYVHVPPSGPEPAPIASDGSASPQIARARSFHLSAEVKASTAKMKLRELAEEIIEVLQQDPTASVKVVVEMSAEYPNGVSDGIRRAVTENAKALNAGSPSWE